MENRTAFGWITLSTHAWSRISNMTFPCFMKVTKVMKVMRISLHICISLHFFSFLYISLHFSSFLYISLHFSTFLCISLYFSEFICISLHFSEFLRIYLHFSKFICIYMHFTFCILGQFDGVYRCPMDAILEGGLIHFKKDFLCMAARCWGAEHRRRPLGWWEPGRSWSLMLACINPWQHDNHESGLGEVPKL